MAKVVNNYSENNGIMAAEAGDLLHRDFDGDIYLLARVDNGWDGIQYSAISMTYGNRFTSPKSKNELLRQLSGRGFTLMPNAQITIERKR